MPRLRGHGFRGSEQGFTLPEVLLTVALLGILLTIATSMWFGVVEARRVDSAANQLAADLRLANGRATNQLTEWRVMIYEGRGDPGDGADYRLIRASGGFSVDRFLPENSMISGSELNEDGGSRILRFRSDGSVDVVGGFGDADGDGEIRITVGVDGGPSRNVTIVPATSRVKLDI